LVLLSRIFYFVADESHTRLILCVVATLLQSAHDLVYSLDLYVYRERP